MITSLRFGYARFLSSQPWDVFATLTFDRSHRANLCHERSPEWVDKAFRRLIQFTNEQLYGKRWLRNTPHKGVVWARSQEPHADGTLHYHACIHSPSVEISQALMRAMSGWWKRRYGFARIEPPRSTSSVVEYLVKHVVPGLSVEVDFSHNFPKAE